MNDENVNQVRTLRALEALIAEHDVADAGSECDACPGQSYPCETRTHAEDAASRLRHRIATPRRPASGQPKPAKGTQPMDTKGINLDLTRAQWRKSSASDNSGGNCVEVAKFSGAVAVRDSKNPDGAVLVYTVTEWSAFVDGVRDGEFD